MTTPTISTPLVRSPTGAESPASTPYRQIRAHFDADTITVYQAYNDVIASAALTSQRLDASPLFKPGRMTWVKPSFSWMMYRSGFSHKDRNQQRILALHLTHASFLSLLRRAVLSHGLQDGSAPPDDSVRVQWDPERSPSLARLPYRSIQIGIPGALVEEFAREMVVKITDETERAKALKRWLDEKGVVIAAATGEGSSKSRPSGGRELSEEDWVAMVREGMLPEECAYEVPRDVRDLLRMDWAGADDAQARKRKMEAEAEGGEKTTALDTSS